MDPSLKIGFIGAGNMAQAIGISIIKKKLVTPGQIYVSAPSARNFEKWNELEVNTTHDNNVIVTKCDVIFLAMKPQYLDAAIKSIIQPTSASFHSKTVVSIIAGLSLNTLRSKLQIHLPTCRLIRVAPNTAVMVAEGFSAICPDDNVDAFTVKLISTIMSAGGNCDIIPEFLMSAVSALSGSGIAFGFSVIEAMADGAVKQGVPRAQAYRMAAQAMLGAAKLILETGEHPGVLRDKVCSPGGTTIQGIAALEKGGLRFSLMDAIEATTNRAIELDKMSQK